MSITRNCMFRSTAFNTSERRDYFLNDCCFGDDLARWLIQELRGHGFRAEEEPGQEDFGWYLNFTVQDVDYCLLIRYRPAEDAAIGDWICTLERITGVGPIGFFLGAAKRQIHLGTAQAIHTVLSSSPQITDIRWFTDADFKNEQDGKPHPVEG